MAVVATVSVSELAREDRWEAEFFDPKYNPPAVKGAAWELIGGHLEMAQYGSSSSLNEQGRGFPILRLNELEHGLVTRPKKHVVLPRDQYDRLRLRQDDLLFCRTNGNFFLVGRTGMLKEPLEACFASYLIRVRPRRESLIPEYLNAYLNTQLGRRQIQRRAMRSNQVNVSAAQLRRIPIPIPDDPAVQDRVARLFNEHASEVLEARRAYADACTIVDAACPLPDVGTSSGEGLKLSTLLGANRWDSEYLAPVARAAREAVRQHANGFERLVDVAAAIDPYADPLVAAASPLRYVELANLDPSVGLVHAAKDLQPSALPDRARRAVAAGDVIVSAVAGSSDRAALIDTPYAGALASTGFVQLRAEHVDPAYLLTLTRASVVRVQLEREATGGILSAIPKSRLANVIVPILEERVIAEAADLVNEAHCAFRRGLERFDAAKALIENLAA